MRSLLNISASIAFLIGTLAAGANPSAPNANHRVLFIGNSLTATNSLPAMVSALADAGDAGRIETRTIAVGGYSLEDHWNDGPARRAITEGGWSFVVLQQGPSALPESQVLLREYSRRFNDLIVRAGARTALYMVWPSRDRFGDFDGVRDSYAKAAKEVDGLLLPAGEAWRAAWRRDRNLALYGADNFHPSPLGSYLAAVVIVQGITGRTPSALPRLLDSPARLFPRIEMTEAEAKTLQQAAADVSRDR
jgi:hypothetical protein